MDEVLLGEVSHSICNLAGELEQEGGEVGVLGRAEGGQGVETMLVGMCCKLSAAGAPLTSL